MRIGIDLDGVCYDFGASVREYLLTQGARLEDMPAPTRWEFYEDWGLSLAEFLDVAARGVDAGVIFNWGDPMPGVRDALQRLRDAGHTIHIITDRSQGSPGVAQRNTFAWLHRYHIPYDTVTFSRDKTVVPTDYMIEDKLSNYDALARTNCRPYLVNRPWNNEPDERRRVGSIGEFVDKILATRIIGLGGYGRTGKDTAAKILVEQHGYMQASFAAKLKEAVATLNPLLDTADIRPSDFRCSYGFIDWEHVKDAYPEGRRLLQAMGTDVGRRLFGDNIWVDLAMRSIPAGAKVVFSDCRFPNEADAVKAAGGEVWRLTRPGFGPVNDHVSETALDGYPHDHLLLNDGAVEDLHWRIQGLMWRGGVSRVADDGHRDRSEFVVDVREG